MLKLFSTILIFFVSALISLHGQNEEIYYKFEGDSITKKEFELIGDLITKTLKGLSENSADNSKIEKEVQKEVIDLCASFPIYSIN